MTGSTTQKFTASQSIDLTLSKKPIPIQHYLRQPQRLVHALVDPSRMEVLGPDYFRLKMRPLNFLMLSVQPTVDMRVWIASNGILKVRSVDCTIHGLEYVNNRFELNLIGQLQPIETPDLTILSGRADLEVIVDIPPPLWLTPKPLLEATGTSLLKSVLLTIKQRLSHQLLTDYHTWVRDQMFQSDPHSVGDSVGDIVPEGLY